MTKKIDKKLRRIFNLAARQDRLMFQISTSQSSVKKTQYFSQYLLNQTRLLAALNDRQLNAMQERLRSDRNQYQYLYYLRAHFGTGSKSDIVKEAYATIKSEGAWQDFKKAKKPASEKLLKKLDTLLQIKRSRGQAKAKKLGLTSAYDALINAYTPGITEHTMQALEKDLLSFNQNFLSNKLPEKSWPMDRELQLSLCRKILTHLGLDFNRLEFKENKHSMCFGDRDKVYLAINVNEGDFAKTLCDLVHEAGHALVRQNMPKGDIIKNQALDEAMALIMEMNIAKSRGFSKFIIQSLSEKNYTFPSDLTVFTLEQRLQNFDHYSERTSAGEKSYPLHIFLREKLARQMIDQNLDAQDIPKEWKKIEQSYFKGLIKSTDQKNYTQDIHWFGGAIGYFPSYLVGLLTAAQIYDHALNDDPNLKRDIHQFKPRRFIKWMKDNVYKNAGKIDLQAFLEETTNQKLSTKPYKKRLQGPKKL